MFASIEQAPRYESADIVNRFREQQARPSGPATPPRPTQAPPRPPPILHLEEVREEEEPLHNQAAAYSNPFEEEDAPGPSSAASSGSQMPSHESHDTHQNLQEQAVPDIQQLQAQEEIFTPVSTPRPEAITTPAAAAPSLPPRSPSVNSMASPRALNHVDSHSSTDSANGNNVAIGQSKEQSRQLLEKASQKLASLLVNANDKNFDASRRPGDPAVRRAPQVSQTLFLDIGRWYFHKLNLGLSWPCPWLVRSHVIVFPVLEKCWKYCMGPCLAVGSHETKAGWANVVLPFAPNPC